MSRRVHLTARAKDDLRQYFLHAAEHAPEAAKAWLERFEQALNTLGDMPERCAVAPENDRVEPEVRQFLFGRGRQIYRSLFVVEDAEIRVLHIRRGTRDLASSDDLSG